MATGTAKVVIGADVGGAVAGVKKVDDALKGARAQANSFSTGMASGMAASLVSVGALSMGFRKVVDWIHVGIKEAADFNVAMGNLSENMKRMGSVDPGIDKWIGNLEQLTRIDDSKIASLMSKITLANVPIDQAKNLTRLAFDVEKAGGGSAEGFATGMISGAAGRMRTVQATAAAFKIDPTGKTENQIMAEIQGRVSGAAERSAQNEGFASRASMNWVNRLQDVGQGVTTGANRIDEMMRSPGGPAVGFAARAVSPMWTNIAGSLWNPGGKRAAELAIPKDYSSPVLEGGDTVVKEDKGAASGPKLLPGQASTADIKVSVAHGASDRVSVTGATR